MKSFRSGRYIILVSLLFVLSACGTDQGGGASPNSTQSTLVGGAIQGKSLQLSQMVSTIAGVTPGSSDGIGNDARFSFTDGITTDGANLYVADRGNATIRKIEIATRNVTTLAGKARNFGSVDDIGAAARFYNPGAITSDGANLYVADGPSIRKIVIATGAVTTLAGNANNPGEADGIGSAAGFRNPSGIATDGTNLFVADSGNFTIRKVVIATGEVTTLVGAAGISGINDGTGAEAEFGYLGGIVNVGTSLYVADRSNCTIRKIVVNSGEVTTIAGSPSSFRLEDGVGLMARFSTPQGMATDGLNLYITESGNGTIRKLELATGLVTTMAGGMTTGSIDGVGSAALFYSPVGVAVNGAYLYVSDSGNFSVRKVTVNTGEVTTFAGKSSPGTTDGVGVAARFNGPDDVTTDGTNLYIADTGNHLIRKVELASGVVSTVAGAANMYGSTDGVATAASFASPKAITTDGTNLFVSDSSNHTIRKIVIATGKVTTMAGYAGIGGAIDGVGSSARFRSPYGLTTDGTSLFVSDFGNHTIRRVDIATGVVTTLAGVSGTSGSDDGTGTAARFYYPYGITTDGTHLYVADFGNARIRKIVISTGEVTTMAAISMDSLPFTGKVVNSTVYDVISVPIVPAPVPVPVPIPNITPIPISLNSPYGITTDGKYLYITSHRNVRKMVISTGVVTTIAGGLSGSEDGAGALASFGGLCGITTDGTSLYVTDNSNNAIRKID